VWAWVYITSLCKLPLFYSPGGARSQFNPPFRRPPILGGSAVLIFSVSKIPILNFYKVRLSSEKAGFILWLTWKSWLYGVIKGQFLDGLSSGKRFLPFPGSKEINIRL